VLVVERHPPLMRPSVSVHELRHGRELGEALERRVGAVLARVPGKALLEALEDLGFYSCHCNFLSGRALLLLREWGAPV
jgi:hypothetical protein